MFTISNFSSFDFNFQNKANFAARNKKNIPTPKTYLIKYNTNSRKNYTLGRSNKQIEQSLVESLVLLAMLCGASVFLIL